ncbi:MAG: hypothetical protein RLZZ618_4090 [Pseudomonadota bacterium]|jgi:hypothetical protein
MPSHLPLTEVVRQILLHTPFWVWGILLIITLIGVRQSRDSVVTRRRLIGVSVGFSIYSFVGAMSTLGFHADVALAWMVGSLMSVSAILWLSGPREVRQLSDGVYGVSGSLVPLFTMWSIFALRYAVAVSLVMHPDWAHLSSFSDTVALLYGAFSGVFVARTLQVLRSRQTAPLSLA